MSTLWVLIRNRGIQAALFVFAFFMFLGFAPGHWITWTYPFAPFATASILRGEINTEIGQDIIGFQRMEQRINPYTLVDGPFIGAREGLYSTHPPTAFLLTAPVAFLPLKQACMAWAWLMVFATLASLRLFGSSWSSAIIIFVLSILWIPTSGSLGQLTPIWLLGCALAYYFRKRSPFAAGIFIAFASLTKYMPALMLVLFIIRQKWTALVGFVLVWAAAIGTVLLISPNVIWQLYESNKRSLIFYLMRDENFGLVSFAYKQAGFVGIALILLFMLLILILYWRELTGAEISTTAWHVTSFFAVALLPLTWFYSFFPLLPTFLWLLNKKGVSRLFGWFALLIPPYFPFINMLILGMALIGNCRSQLQDRPVSQLAKSVE